MKRAVRVHAGTRGTQQGFGFGMSDFGEANRHPTSQIRNRKTPQYFDKNICILLSNQIPLRLKKQSILSKHQ